MGKPSEREGRKAMDLQTNVYDRQVALVFLILTLPGVFYLTVIQVIAAYIQVVYRKDKHEY